MKGSRQILLMTAIGVLAIGLIFSSIALGEQK